MDRLRRWSFAVFLLAALIAAVAVVGHVLGDDDTADTASTARSTIPLSAFAEEILADGVVTRAEIEQARAATTACFEAEGFTATFDARDDRVSNLQVDSNTPRAGESFDDFSRRYDSVFESCRNEYLAPIDSAWLRATAPSDEERRAAFVILQHCVESFGSAIASPSAEAFGQLTDRLDDKTLSDAVRIGLRDCVDSYSVATASGSS